MSAPGATLTIVPSKRWTIRPGAFDGVPGDLDRPKAFVAERLGKHAGVLTIVQTDYQLGKDSRIELGAWRYGASVPAIDGGSARDLRAYVSLEAPLPIAPSAQTVAGYIGTGAVQTGTFAARQSRALASPAPKPRWRRITRSS